MANTPSHSESAVVAPRDDQAHTDVNDFKESTDSEESEAPIYGQEERPKWQL